MNVTKLITVKKVICSVGLIPEVIETVLEMWLVNGSRINGSQVTNDSRDPSRCVDPFDPWRIWSSVISGVNVSIRLQDIPCKVPRRSGRWLRSQVAEGSWYNARAASKQQWSQALPLALRPNLTALAVALALKNKALTQGLHTKALVNNTGLRRSTSDYPMSSRWFS